MAMSWCENSNHNNDNQNNKGTTMKGAVVMTCIHTLRMQQVGTVELPTYAWGAWAWPLERACVGVRKEKAMLCTRLLIRHRNNLGMLDLSMIRLVWYTTIIPVYIYETVAQTISEMLCCICVWYATYCTVVQPEETQIRKSGISERSHRHRSFARSGRRTRATDAM